MNKVKSSAVFAVMLLAFVMAFTAFAQDNGQGGEGGQTGQQNARTGQQTTQTGQTNQQTGQTTEQTSLNQGFTQQGGENVLLTQQESSNMMATLPTPSNGTLIGIVRLSNFNSYIFQIASTQTQQQGQTAQAQNCGNVNVYKISPQGVLDLWTNVSCGTGNQLTVRAGGTGHYVLYRFNSNQNAFNAPLSMNCVAGQQAQNQGNQQNQSTQQGQTAAQNQGQAQNQGRLGFNFTCANQQGIQQNQQQGGNTGVGNS
jgi:hypothetical protein